MSHSSDAMLGREHFSPYLLLASNAITVIPQIWPQMQSATSGCLPVDHLQTRHSHQAGVSLLMLLPMCCLLACLNDKQSCIVLLRSLTARCWHGCNNARQPAQAAGLPLAEGLQLCTSWSQCTNCVFLAACQMHTRTTSLHYHIQCLFKTMQHYCNKTTFQTNGVCNVEIRTGLSEIAAAVAHRRNIPSRIEVCKCSIT